MAAISSKSTLCELPLEVSTEIFSYLNEEERCRVAHVSKQVKAIVLDALEAQIRNNKGADIRTLTEYAIRLGASPKDLRITLFEKLFKTPRLAPVLPQSRRALTTPQSQTVCNPTLLHIETLDLSSSDIYDSELIELLNNLPNLRHLKINGCERLTSAAFQVIANCKQLTSLEARRTRLNDGALSAIISRCPELRSLDLRACDQLTNKGLESITRCPQLVSLDLGIGVTALALTDTTLLAILDKCPHLQSLGLSWCQSLTPAAFSAIAKRRELQCLEASATQISDQALLEISRCPHLRSLDLSNCKQLTKDGFGALANCKELEFLDARDTNISDETLSAIALRCPQLRSLTLAYCIGVKQEGIKAIAKIGKQLDHLDLSATPIGDEEFLLMINECEQLRSLNLSKCHYLSTGFEAIARCHHLRSLTAPDSGISGKALSEIVPNCPYLESLDLSGSRAIKPREFAAIHHPNLSYLNLTSTSIDDQTLVEIILNCPNLRGLTITDCRNLTLTLDPKKPPLNEEALREMILNCPNLQNSGFIKDGLLADDVIALIQKRCHALHII